VFWQATRSCDAFRALSFEQRVVQRVVQRFEQSFDRALSRASIELLAEF
jgi:hypothetical protein